MKLGQTAPHGSRRKAFRLARARRTARRNARGVSPIIATILLVAITVVLAAVLYVLVSGLTKTGVSTPYELGMGETSATGSGTNYTIVVSMSPTTGLTTSLFGLKIVTVGGTTMTVGTVPSGCHPDTTLVAAQAACTGVASGYFVLLLNPSGFLAGTFGKNATTGNVQWNYASGTTTLALNGGFTFWVLSQSSLTGAGNVMTAYGTGTSSVSGTVSL